MPLHEIDRCSANMKGDTMPTKSALRPVLLLAALLWYSCGESSNCPCSQPEIEPPLSELSITWDHGSISANLMPIVLPDPVICQAWLILENKSKTEAFSGIQIPTAGVFLAENDSALGTISLETVWSGYLAPGTRDTVLFFKNAGSGESFDPPCGERVLLDFLIQDADGDTALFRSDALTFTCVF